MAHDYERSVTDEPPVLLVLLAGAAIAWTLPFVQLLWRDPDAYDFGSFYRSGLAWNAGLSAYQGARPNLNPPWLTALVFAPLAHLSIQVALSVWLAINALALWRTFVLITRELSLTPRQVLWMFIILALSYSWMLQWWQGQIGFLLMYFATEGWRAARHNQPWRAGCWLAMVIAAKPSLALAALPLGIITLTAAAVSSFAISLVGVLLTGVGPWIDWLQVSRTITWYSHSPNASILGVLARLNGAGGRDFLPLSAIPSTWLIAAAIAALAMIVVSLRCRHPDHRWAAGILMAVAIFPLGWSYYLPLALGPLAGTLRRFSWVAATGAVALALQMPLLPFAGNEGLDFVFVASLGCAATVLLWLAVVYEPETSTS